MKKEIVFVIIGILFSVCIGYGHHTVPNSDEEYADELYDSDFHYAEEVKTETIMVPHYISNLNEVTKNFGMSFDQYVKEFLLFKDEKDTASRFSSDMIYLNYFLPLLRSESDFLDKRLVIREYSFDPKSNFTRMRLTQLPALYSRSLDSLALDVMFCCRGDENTDLFLKSPHYMNSCMVELFSAIHYSQYRNIRGINLYFPDYSFKEKRAMVQFIKSVSLVVDSSRMKEIRDLRLYATFDRSTGLENRNYLCSLTQLVDSVLLLDEDEIGQPFPPMMVLNKANADSLSTLFKIMNQFYLARYSTGTFPVTSATQFRPEDIRAIMNSDYPDNRWETYMFILIGLVILVLILIVFYWSFPTFSYYINKNIDLMLSVLIMVVLEFYLLLFTMFAAMSKDDVFTFNGINGNNILFIPLLLVVIIPLIKVLGKKRNLP